MKHAVIVAHPNPHSLTRAAADAYAEQVGRAGHEVVIRDLYQLGFDPCLKAWEVPRDTGYHFDPDVLREREQLARADVFVLVYPFWFNAPPAILKGYIDRVFSMDFGYGATFGGTEPYLDDRKLLSITFSGAPDSWVRDTGALSTLMAHLDRHLAAVTGMQIVDHLHTGGIVPNLTEEAFFDILSKVRGAAARYFPAEISKPVRTH